MLTPEQHSVCGSAGRCAAPAAQCLGPDHHLGYFSVERRASCEKAEDFLRPIDWIVPLSIVFVLLGIIRRSRLTTVGTNTHAIKPARIGEPERIIYEIGVTIEALRIGRVEGAVVGVWGQPSAPNLMKT